MKRTIKAIFFSIIISCLLISIMGTSNLALAKSNQDLLFEKKNYKGAFLMDYDSETIMYQDNETEHLPIASMCKIMTLLVCFDEIEKGNISLTEEITVSDNASSMGGSQVFLETNGRYIVSNLLKSITVCSANDSCVAMAERVAGSETAFVDRMNEKAKEIGANDTVFVNCTGLPKEGQYSCAKDVALMLKNLLKHKEYFKYSKVWLENFEHPKGRHTEMTNTNKLIRFYDGCDGGKTGFTNQAGFCLACTAKRGNMRSIAVVVGSPSSDERFKATRKLLDFSFANYTSKQVLDMNEVVNEKCNVRGGKEKVVSVKPSDNAFVFAKRNEENEINIMYNITDSIKAPVSVGDKVGTADIYKDNILIKSVDLVASEDIARSSVLDSLKNVAEKWGFK